MRECMVGVLVVGLVAGAAACAQEVSPASRLSEAAELMSLSQVDQRPWHLKMDVTAFDERGANPKQGTIEVWQAGADQRVMTTFGDATSTSLHHDGKRYLTSRNDADMPPVAEVVLDKVLHFGPEPDEIQGTKPELRKVKAGKLPIDCVMLSQSIGVRTEIPLGLFPTYCIDATHYMRISYDFGSQTVVVNSIGKFREHALPTQIDILEGKTRIASGKVTMLASYTTQPDEFLPGADAREVGGAARISGGVIKDHRITFTEPVYPEDEKMRHESGMVVLRAVIGRDGRIRLLRPMSSSEPDFAMAAIAAVRKWTYKPYLLNGEPTEVDTTITVNFAVN